MKAACRSQTQWITLQFLNKINIFIIHTFQFQLSNQTNNLSCDAAGQFVCAVQLGGGNRLWFSGEVPGTGQPVHQRGSVPAVRCSFSEGWTLVPHGFSLNTKIFARTAFPGSSVWMLCSVEVLRGNVWFLSSQLMREESHCELQPERGISGFGFETGVGILLP